jgi:hypothetical protein
MKNGDMEAAADVCRRWLSESPGSRAALRSFLFLLPYRMGLTPEAVMAETAGAWMSIGSAGSRPTCATIRSGET